MERGCRGTKQHRGRMFTLTRRRSTAATCRLCVTVKCFSHTAVQGFSDLHMTPQSCETAVFPGLWLVFSNLVQGFWAMVATHVSNDSSPPYEIHEHLLKLDTIVPM